MTGAYGPRGPLELRGETMSDALPSPAGSRDGRLQDYLDRIMAPLVETVPYEKRGGLRAELASHLDALVAAHIEMGSSLDGAVELTLAEFGDPRKLARRWLAEWRLALPPPGSPLPAMGVGLACFL